MKTISLTQGKVALVDDENFERLNVYRWYTRKLVLKSRVTYYAVRNLAYAGKQRTVQMHRQILGLTDSRIQTDHQNGDGLDNQNKNLRVATPTENQRNQRKRINCSSEFKGVCWHKAARKWEAYIRINGQRQHLGLLETEKAAAAVYDQAARHEFSDYALTNNG